MRFRNLALFAVLSLVVAACGGVSTESTTTSTTEGSTTTTAALETPDEQLLAYSLAAGDSFVYEVEITQQFDLTAEGEGAGFVEEEGEELPGEASVSLQASGTFTFDIADGPEAGTYEVTITSDITDVTASGTVDGEPIDDEEIPGFAEMEPVSMTVVVDEQGNLVQDEPDLEDPFTGMFGGMGDFGAMPGTELGQFFGPPFADEEVTVGDSWSSSFDTPGLGEDPITTSINSTVTGADTIDGFDVFVIESETAIDDFEFDLGQFLIGFFTGFMPEDPTDEEQAELDAIVENLRFLMSFKDTGSESTTLFDAEAGLTRSFEVSARSTIGMDVNFPDDETGEMVGFVMDMTIDQTIVHRLVSGPAA